VAAVVVVEVLMRRTLGLALCVLALGACGSESDGAGAGQGGAGGDDPMGGSGGAGGDAEGCEKGTIAPSEVVMIGDSYLALSGDVKKLLTQYALEAGALGEGESYRNYYVSGTQLGGTATTVIPTQYDKAVAEDPNIKLLIMTGGGNDVLIGNRSCLQTSPPENTSCLDTIDASLAAAQTLFEKAAADGVTDIIYFFYPHLPEGGVLSGPAVNTTTDYAYPLVQDGCESFEALRCHFIDTRPAFEGHADYIGRDGVHPTLAGSTAIADLIWDVMVEECLAQ
jgi:hypothetical protein